jgi:hypothetical protein
MLFSADLEFGQEVNRHLAQAQLILRATKRKTIALGNSDPFMVNLLARKSEARELMAISYDCLRSPVVLVNSLTGRTSILPTRAGGICEAIWMASFMSAASIK